MREVPDVIYFECPDCDDIMAHDVLRGKMGKASMEATIRCQECKRISTTIINVPKIIPAKVILSNGPESETTSMEIESDDLLVVGDEFFLDDGRRVKITALELSGGRRPSKVQATEGLTIWAMLFDTVNIKVSINDVQRTYARFLEAEPDDEFYVGQTLGFGDIDCLIHSIKIKERMIRRGSAEARNIVRIYGKLRKRSFPVIEFEDDVEDI